MINWQMICASNLIEAKEIIDKKTILKMTDLEFSRNLFRKPLGGTNPTVINAHLQSMSKQLNEILGDDKSYLKKNALFIEFSKALTLFDLVTKELKLKGATHGDNFIRSNTFYLDAVKSYNKYTPILFQGDLELSYIPMKLRLAIETYFKNMIGFKGATQTHKSCRKKGEEKIYPLPISKLLNFFSNTKYRKYVKLPVDLTVVKDINYWSNQLVHTGIISFPWQGLTAIDFLHKLFYCEHENGAIHLEGFNYLNRELNHSDMIHDLSEFLSTRNISVKVYTYDISKKPIEGAYYY